MQPVEINPNDFIYNVPITASDGQYIQVRDNGAIVDIISLQFRSFNTKTPNDEVVAAIRLQNGIQGLKNLKKAIEENIKQVEDREP